MNSAWFTCGRHDNCNDMFVFQRIYIGELPSVCILQFEWLPDQKVNEMWVDG